MLGDAPEVPRVIRESIRHARPYARLGAMYHDLPYFIGLVDLCIGYWRERAIDITPWGYRLHCEKPGEFAEHIVRTMRTTDGPITHEQRLAFIAGFLSHAILDHTLHPLVNHVSERQTQVQGGEVSHHHRLVEKFHSIFFHLERFGEDVLGSSVMRDRTDLTGSSRVEPGVAEFMTNLARDFYGIGPTPEEWSDWVRCYKKVSFLLSTFPAARNSRRVRTDEMRERYYTNAQYDFRDFFAAAEKRTHGLLQFANDYFEAGDFAEASRQRFVEAAALDDLAFPDRDRHPERRIIDLPKSA